MVKVSLGAVALSMIVIGTTPAIAAGTTPAEPTRSSIEWLLDDLGAIFEKAVTLGTESLTASPKSVPVVEQLMPAPSAKPSKSDEPVVVDVAPVESTQTATAQTENPFVAIFDAIAAFFAENPPSMVVENESAPAPAPPAVAAQPEPIVAPPARVVDNRDALETGTPRDPVSWLLADIGALFKNGAEVTSADTSKAPSSPYHGAHADAHSFAIVPTTIIKTAEASMQAPILTPAPWQQPVGRDMFDPQVALFDIEGNAAPAPATRPLHAVETATLAAPAPQIRKRPDSRPGERNHVGLGHNHKAVSPDPDEPNLIGDIFARMFGPDGDDVDAMVNAEQTTEPLANKISHRIVAEERLDLSYTAPDADLANLAPGTDDAPDATIEQLRETALGNIDLYVGKDTVIGTPYDAKKFGPEDCIERPLHGSIFCLATLHWPADIVEQFAVDTAFTLPGEALIRFENGTISRVYAIFDSQNFADVVKHMQRNFGAPSEREIVWMPVMEAPRLPNTTFRWKALSADRKDTMILEVRNYDDLRRSFADMEHGLVRLYRDGSRPIFKHISTMDLMLMQRKRVARAPVAINAPPPQQ